MLTKYSDFLLEANSRLNLFLLNKYSPEKDINGLINCTGQVRMDNCGLYDFPYDFGEICGSFSCTFNKISSLEKGPKSVTTYMNITDNKLVNLSNFPSIGTHFHCSNNKITSLEGCQQEFNGEFHCSNNKLKSLKGGPKILKSNFRCDGNKLTSLEYCPEYIGGDFYCNYNEKIKNLDFFPKIIKKDFYCVGIPLSIEDYPIHCEIGGKVFGNKETHFDEISYIVKKYPNVFENIMDDKVLFHKQVMRLCPDLIQYYLTISPPSNKTII